jgi:type IV secretory pathway VirJ component
MLFWIYIAYRAYGFLTTISTAFKSLNGSLPPSDQIIDVILFVLTIFLLFEGIGTKLSRSSLLSKENIPFIAYILATAVVMGTVSMTVAYSLPLAAVSAINDIMMMSIAIVYYFIYIKRKLAQQNYLERDNYSLHEIQGIFQEFATTMVSHHSNLDSKDVSEELASFLASKDMATVASVAPKPEVKEAPAATPKESKPAPQPQKPQAKPAAKPAPAKPAAKPAPAKDEEEEEAPAKDEEEEAPAKDEEEEAPAKDEEEEAPAKDEEAPTEDSPPADDAPADEE